jgi:hypothetical protein
MNINKKTIQYGLILSLLTVFIASCNKDTNNAPDGIYGRGLFIVNEGAVDSETGTITFRRHEGAVIQDVFGKENSGAILGKRPKSMIKHKDKYYIAVSGENKVVVVDANTFKLINEITGIPSPQYFAGNFRSLFVNSWDSIAHRGKIFELDGDNNSILTSFDVGGCPGEILLNGKWLYVPLIKTTKPTGELRIIDIYSSGFEVQVVKEVCDNPVSLAKKFASPVYLLCSGFTDINMPENNTEGSIVEFSDTSFVKSMAIANGAKSLISDDNLLYYLTNNSYHSVNNGNVHLIMERTFNRIGLGLGNSIITCDALDFNMAGIANIRSRGGASLIYGVFATGIVPTYVYVARN